MRAGDAVEKVSRQRPEWLRPIGQDLLDPAATTDEQELQWHLAQLLPRVGHSVCQRQALVPVLRRYLQVPSAIVRVSALQALVELMGTDGKLRPFVRRQLRRAPTEGTAGERARARKLLAAGAA
jgi:HEAT repeat protein